MFAICNFKGHNHSLSRRAPLLSFRYTIWFNLFSFLVNFISYLLFHLIYLILYYHLLRFGGTNKMKWKWITPILFDLPVSYHVVFKLLLSVFKSLNNLPPSYLADRLSYQGHPRNLWSASQQMLQKTSKTYETYGDKSFSLCAPIEFNVSLLKAGMGYGAINTARSGFPCVLTLKDGVMFREHPPAVRCMKGIFEGVFLYFLNFYLKFSFYRVQLK